MRKLIICVAVAGLLAALCCAAGLAATYGDFTYEVMEDGNVRVSAYNGTSTTVVIPGSINGRTVTRAEHTTRRTEIPGGSLKRTGKSSASPSRTPWR